MHSTFSDGTCTPEELIQIGKKIGLTSMALTDHDTTGGISRFLAAAKAEGIRALPGVEVSADPPSGTMHVLGYCVDCADAEFNKHLEWIREGREERNREILQKLNQLGMRITMDEVQAQAGGDIVARPHFAQVMIAKGYAKDKKDAFERFLARGKAAYCERRRLDAVETIELIRSARGVPVIAHPFTLKLSHADLRDLLKRLADAGLLGLECYYTEHSPDMQREYLKLAKEFNLVPTGGSDFHGTVSPNTRMGVGYGGLSVPDDVVDRIDAVRPV